MSGYPAFGDDERVGCAPSGVHGGEAASWVEGMLVKWEKGWGRKDEEDGVPMNMTDYNFTPWVV